MFPNDTKYITAKVYDNSTSGTVLTASNNEKTILWITSNCSAGNNELLNNGLPIVSLSGTQNHIETYSRYIVPVNTAITYTKTSSGNCFYRLLYVDYNLSLVSTTTPTTIAISSGVSLSKGFTYGEVLIILVLLMIFTQAFFSELKQWIFGVRVENPMKNKYNKDL